MYIRIKGQKMYVSHINGTESVSWVEASSASKLSFPQDTIGAWVEIVGALGSFEVEAVTCAKVFEEG